MTPREWNHVLDHKVEWSIAYPAVAREAQNLLRRVEWPGLTTNGLVELLYPYDTSLHGEGPFARRRIFTALDALREHELADWCHQEEPTRARFGKMIRRVRWHQPQAVTEAEEVQTPEPSPACERPNPALFTKAYTQHLWDALDYILHDVRLQPDHADRVRFLLGQACECDAYSGINQISSRARVAQ